MSVKGFNRLKRVTFNETVTGIYCYITLRSTYGYLSAGDCRIAKVIFISNVFVTCFGFSGNRFNICMDINQYECGNYKVIAKGCCRIAYC